MSKIDIRNQRLQTYVPIAESEKAKIVEIAENKSISVTSGTDTPLTVLTKIDNGTIKTPTGTKNITDTALTDVTNYANAQVVDSNLTSENIITGKTILGVSGSAVVPSGTLPITSNGIVDVTNYANANVNVQPNLQNISETITQNGTQTFSAGVGYDGLGQVEITTNVDGYQVESIDNGDGTQTLEITEGEVSENNVDITNFASGDYTNYQDTQAYEFDLMCVNLLYGTYTIS